MSEQNNQAAKELKNQFIQKKKEITLEDCVKYIEIFAPDDKQWFYDLCCRTQTEADGSSVPKKWVDIKKDFYNKYFPKSTELSKRQKVMAHWGLEVSADEPATTENSK